MFLHVVLSIPYLKMNCLYLQDCVYGCPDEFPYLTNTCDQNLLCGDKCSDRYPYVLRGKDGESPLCVDICPVDYSPSESAAGDGLAEMLCLLNDDPNNVSLIYFQSL